MEELLKTLEDYASSCLVAPRLKETNYHRMGLALETHWEEFRATLSEEQIAELEKIQDEEAGFHNLEGLAYFRAALSIGMELSRF